MKTTVLFLTLFVLALLPMACAERNLTAPIIPNVVPTPTQVPASYYLNQGVPTPTATP